MGSTCSQANENHQNYCDDAIGDTVQVPGVCYSCTTQVLVMEVIVEPEIFLKMFVKKYHLMSGILILWHHYQDFWTSVTVVIIIIMDMELHVLAYVIGHLARSVEYI